MNTAILNVFVEGVILGIITSFTLGPAFFAVIQTGINRGFKSGFFMALGISLSDITLISICYLGASVIFDSPENKLYIGIVGGILLVGFGVFTFIKKPDMLRRRSGKHKTQGSGPGPITYLLKGYFLNVLNPFLFVFWLTAMGWVGSNAPEGKLLNYTLVFFSGTLITVFGMDLLKSFVGNKIKAFLRPRIQLWINRGIGIILGASGLILIIRVFINF